MELNPASHVWLDNFVAGQEPMLRRALMARFGPEVGAEATADALEYAAANSDRLSRMANPAGYLFRVGQSAARRYRHRGGPVFPEALWRHEPAIDDRLGPALEDLSPRQRAVVVLVCAYDYKQNEVADLLGISVSAVRNHLQRAIGGLRAAFGLTEEPQ